MKNPYIKEMQHKPQMNNEDFFPEFCGPFNPVSFLNTEVLNARATHVFYRNIVDPTSGRNA